MMEGDKVVMREETPTPSPIGKTLICSTSFGPDGIQGTSNSH